MKNHLYKAALVAALGLAGATAAQAQLENNDLILGFTSQFSGVTSDYILNLGPLPSAPGAISTGFNSSTFASTFTTSSGNALADGAVNVGIIAGATVNSQPNIIDSALDTSSTPSAVLPGSSIPATASRSNLGSAAGILNSLQTGVQAQGSAASFFSSVAENPTTVGAAGQTTSFSGFVANPLSTIGTSESIVLDLWQNTGNGRTTDTGWTYEGYVDLSFNNGNLTALFDETPTAAPEPSTYGIFGGIGVLLLGLRRQLTRKLA